ncbi:Piso0_003255 [Millerozyma farinosa CBS 7064]|uniref:Piso0_003255 protein n=1 Tax=Pichia sorbitophila (strain ATCC MYA-4447 / BCRC 22081 / CBS 7064 / NBRC 10061 / NRRL Y-12695) TaxID=559304 RepID=G8YHL6_PICSO|nr:Piso0_003255 [Millerozyma farinosa CBS 7064]CCE80918.1 Piso0_003255 [Millerozyma farinosa CBS 7064]
MSERHHVFSSFRERVESIKIEPSLKLNTRVHDYAEDSYFITTLEHWKETNISGNFTEYMEKIEGISQTLPQIIYHQKEIFEVLIQHIERIDVHSIQPLLELLSQFVHDLGPDFMPYYKKALEVLSKIAIEVRPNDSQNNRNTANVLEWCFNTMSLIFKYLARVLAEDLSTTIETLIPVLSIPKRSYVSRFGAEAISYLLRKSKPEAVDQIIKYCFNDNLGSIDIHVFQESIIVMFSESMKNTKNTFHSKSSMILSKLLKNALESGEFKANYISMLGEILGILLNHGTIETCGKLNTLVYEHLSSILDSTNSVSDLISIIQLLSVISFTDSGKKVSDWKPLLEVTCDIIRKVNDNTSIKERELSSVLGKCLSHLITTIFRNCELNELTRYYSFFFEHMILINNGESFLGFLEYGLETSGDKMIKFGVSKYFQEYVDRKKDQHMSDVALFLMKLSDKPVINNLRPILSAGRIKNIIEASKKSKKTSISDDDLYEVFWRVSLLKNCNRASVDFDALLALMEDISKLKSKFAHDSFAIVLDVMVKEMKLEKKDFSALLKLTLSLIKDYKESSFYMAALEKLINASSGVSNELREVSDFIFEECSENLSLPSHEIRYQTIKVMCVLLSKLEMSVSDTLAEIKLIEEIPLTLDNGRNIQLRVRNLVNGFKNSVHSELERKILIRYMFGLLSNHFQPCWQAVYESLPLLVEDCSSLIWEHCYFFLTFNFEAEADAYFNGDLGNVSSVQSFLEWNVRSGKLREKASYYCEIDESYSYTKNAFVRFIQEKRANNEYSRIIRSKVIEGLDYIPLVAEKNSHNLVPLVLHEVDEDDYGSWSLKERNSIIKIFKKFNNLRKVYKSDQLFQHMLKLLSNKNNQVQSISLEVLINWNVSYINKHKDILRNLLDDTIFKDEISKFYISSTNSDIANEDFIPFMNIVLRILFGKSQQSTRSNSKSGKKHAVISVLPNIPEKSVIEFVKLGAERIDYSTYYETNSLPCINYRLLRRITGFVNLLSEVYSVLKFKYKEVLTYSVRPLIYVLDVAQSVLDAFPENEEEMEMNKKIAKNVRQTGMKCLADVFMYLGKDFEWEPYRTLISERIIKPRLKHFADENLQQESSLLKLMTSWVESKNTLGFLFYNDHAPTRAILSLLEHNNAKETVIESVINFGINALKAHNTQTEQYFIMLALIVQSFSERLPFVFEISKTRELNSKATTASFLLVKSGYLEDNNSRIKLANSLTSLLDRPGSQVDPNDKVAILSSLSYLIDSLDCQFDALLPLYEVCSKMLRAYADRSVRQSIVDIFCHIGDKFGELQTIARILSDLNSFSEKRISEIDFQRRLGAFKEVNEQLYRSFTPLEWLPLVYCSLFFINDDIELSMRINATYMLNRFVDCYSMKESKEEAVPYIKVLKRDILPQVRVGIRGSNEVIQTEYVAVLSYIIENSVYYSDLEDMKVLSFNGDEEANFFKNINHIQLHRRQRAIKRLAEKRNELSDNSISHYIMPIIERYASSEDEALRNIANEAVETVGYLTRCISWKQYIAIFKRYIGNLKKAEGNQIRSLVNLIVSASTSLRVGISQRKNDDFFDQIKDLPDQTVIDSSITKDILTPLLSILSTRNDETIIFRMPLSEALVNLVICLSDDIVNVELPGILTSICQVLRSRAEELRDATRKSLGKIGKTLGPRYLHFILKELKSALSRGSQIHVLSFTVHTLIVEVSSSLSSGSLDESISLLVDIIMEDIFGVAGGEKDAEGYTSKMKEVKHKKSYDCAEIVSSFISLRSFIYLLEPIKLLLQERITLKTHNKLDELMKRYALGLSKNEESSKKEILQLCYEIYQFSFAGKKSKSRFDQIRPEDHFLVKLDAKPDEMHSDDSVYIHSFQKLSFELLRTAISRHEDLLTTATMHDFIPIIEKALHSENEGTISSAFKVLTIVCKLNFRDDVETRFKTCARKALNIIKDSPSTNSELAQVCLKYLATAIRNKPEMELKETSISYILSRIQPDLQEPSTQSLSFGFLKAIIGRHIVVPEVYDIMDEVRNIMVVNHTKEIRDMSRSVYFQFLMEYDQGRGRIEKQFKFLVNNLSYVTKEGRQSVMELVHSIIAKSGIELLTKLASSFFIALANNAVSDDSSKCREMATTIISNLLRKLGPQKVGFIEQYCIAWLNQSSNKLLKRCGLIIYKSYIGELGIGTNVHLDEVAHSNIEKILKNSVRSSENELEWELVYTALNVFLIICQQLKEGVFAEKYGQVWKLIVNCLLFPHSWVRLTSGKLTGILLTNLDNLVFGLSNYDIQTIGYRCMRQLAAPSISESLGEQATKNIVLLSMRWVKFKTKYQRDSNADEPENENKFEYAIDFIVSQCCGLIRHDTRDSFVSKKCAIQLAAMLIQIVPLEDLSNFSENILLSLYPFVEEDQQTSILPKELKDLAFECAQMIEEKLGTTQYTLVFANVKNNIKIRRQERKAKRAQLAVTAPEIASRRKLKKHSRDREKRKHVKDENGFYHKRKRIM